MGKMKDKKRYEPNRSRILEEVARIYRTIPKKTKTKNNDPDNHDGVITHLEPTSWKMESSGP